MFTKGRDLIHVLLSLCLFGQGCSSHSLREAQDIIAQADSLWQEGKMYGVDEGDSVTLAQAYETLKPFVHCTSSLCTSYAHSCYHYGKLLRAKDNPVEAMQCFINATHSRTHDHYILGRVYSNMGSICHLAGEFDLSYDMYEKTANCFLADGDTLSYYYGLNDMAFEKAMLADKESCLGLLHNIEHHCIDRDVICKTLETKAELYLKCKLYDSVLYYANENFSQTENTASALLIAQSYNYIGKKDSATYYANLVLSKTQELYEINNALYILTTDDGAMDKDAIRETAADRSDTQKLIEKRKSKLSQAVLLLVQDLARKPDLRWLYTVIAVILFVGSTFLLVHVWRKRKQHQHIIHEIDIKQQQQEQLIESIATLHTEIYQLSEQQQKTHQQLLSDIEATCSALRNTKDFHKEPYWKDYGQLCEMINQRFNNLAVLLQRYSLTEREIRLCILVLIGNLSDKQMADMLYYSYNTIRSTKRHIAIKLGTTSANLRDFLIEKVIE